MVKFKYILTISAISISVIGAYFSVLGLSQLFAGASVAVIVMASILELGKIITTTALHKYWDKLTKGLKTYLTISVVVLMLITSAGIYGFLSNAYQKTANKLEVNNGKASALLDKKTIFEKNILNNENIIKTKNKRIELLTNLRNNQESRIDSAKSNKAKDKARLDITLASNEIQKLTLDIDDLNNKNSILSDSVNKYSNASLEIKSNDDIAGEVGPLKYISELTNTPMNNVVNYLILLLIFVFDPLAIALILMANKAFSFDSVIEKKTTNESLELEKPINEVKEINEEIVNNIKEHDSEKNELFDEPIIDTDPVIDETETQPETVLYKKEPVIPTGKIDLEDIKEKKENRGYSIPIPPSNKQSNTIERIGTNKVVKNGDNNKLFFRRK